MATIEQWLNSALELFGASELLPWAKVVIVNAQHPEGFKKLLENFKLKFKNIPKILLSEFQLLIVNGRPVIAITELVTKGLKSYYKCHFFDMGTIQDITCVSVSTVVILFLLPRQK